MNKEFCETVPDLSFLEDGDNFYRTENFIVKQKLTVIYNDFGQAMLLSVDTYYFRTVKRDNYYDIVFEDRGNNLEGKRTHANTYTRTYVD